MSTDPILRRLIANQGTGPVPDATAAEATRNLGQFVADLRERGEITSRWQARPTGDDGLGRFAYNITMAGGEVVEILMPGLPVEQVRWLGHQGQDPIDYPRMYVNGNSWLWAFALDVIHDGGC